jgi:hypothetical protein
MKTNTMSKVGIAAVLFCTAVLADDGNNGQLAFSSGIIGSTPNQAIAGVVSGGAPWIVREGHARLKSNGRLNVEVVGLVITNGRLANGAPVPPNLVGTTANVNMVAASLVCAGVVTGSTAVAALSAIGDAEMEGKVSLPSSCSAPMVLVRIARSMSATTQDLGAFIALSGMAASDDPGAVNDDRGNDAAPHDVNDNHGNDGAQHDRNDDHGNHENQQNQPDDRGNDGNQHNQGDDHGNGGNEHGGDDHGGRR